jgi:hypothetical protein
VAAGYMIYPCFIPVMHGRSKLSFGFNFDASKPAVRALLAALLRGRRAFLGEMRWRKDFIGPASSRTC